MGVVGPQHIGAAGVWGGTTYKQRKRIREQRR